jgi:hypothetical protein
MALFAGADRRGAVMMVDDALDPYTEQPDRRSSP